MDRDRGRRYDDGEVVRYGAGESWRPTPRGGAPAGGDRSPRRMRSPIRDRPRSPRPRSPRLRSPRPRSPIVPASDSYVPARYAPRRRSRSIGGGDRFRRGRSRDDDFGRRRERTRSPMRRRTPPRRSLSRRRSPIPMPMREDRYDGNRSPRRNWDRDVGRDRFDGNRDREWDRGDRFRGDRDFPRDDRRRSRSPMNRNRERSPLGRGTPLASRAGSYRPRSRSPIRRGDTYNSYRRTPPPPRDLGISSVNSQPVSRRSSPRPSSLRARSPPPTTAPSPRPPPPARAPSTTREPVESASGNAILALSPRSEHHSTTRSPPRGPAALRVPPTGPAAGRHGSASISPAPPSGLRQAPTPGAPVPPLRSDTASPTNPPAGPRGYVPPGRGSYSSRGRGAWSQQTPSRPVVSGSSVSPTAPASATLIPTGPRAPPTGPSSASTPTQSRPFNPPTGPASTTAQPRQTLAQSIIATMPVLVPGGKFDPTILPATLGVTRDLEAHYRKLREEEDKLREELRIKQERLRKSLYVWDRAERESRAWEMRSDLSERSMKNLAGEGMGGASF